MEQARSGLLHIGVDTVAASVATGSRIGSIIGSGSICILVGAKKRRRQKRSHGKMFGQGRGGGAVAARGGGCRRPEAAAAAAGARVVIARRSRAGAAIGIAVVGIIGKRIAIAIAIAILILAMGAAAVVGVVHVAAAFVGRFLLVVEDFRRFVLFVRRINERINAGFGYCGTGVRLLRATTGFMGIVVIVVVCVYKGSIRFHFRHGNGNLIELIGKGRVAANRSFRGGGWWMLLLLYRHWRRLFFLFAKNVHFGGMRMRCAANN